MKHKLIEVKEIFLDCLIVDYDFICKSDEVCYIATTDKYDIYQNKRAKWIYYACAV